MKPLAAAVLAALLAGCGSDPDTFPPPAEPAASPPLTREPAGRVRRATHDVLRHLYVTDGNLRLDPRRRTLTVDDETVPAGIGPTNLVLGNGGRIYVTDTAGGAVLLFRTTPELELVRRTAVPGSPYAIAIDPDLRRLWVTTTATNEAVQLTADGAPRIRRRVPAIRDAHHIEVGEGVVRLTSADGRVTQAFPDR